MIKGGKFSGMGFKFCVRRGSRADVSQAKTQNSYVILEDGL